MKFLCEQCKAKYQIADEKAAGKTVRMKCRKCGHLIEVRAAVTESSAASALPGPGDRGPEAAGGAKPGGIPRPSTRPAPPARGTPLATSLASAKPASKPERSGGALAGAFKSTVQREEEVSAPFDMSDLSPSDEWYVAINGVPVGPIRVGEVRRKAALGAVTEESLCWQEGLDEWRPVRAFPELAAIVREAAASGRTSLTPAPPEGRVSHAPAQPRPGSARPAQPPAPRGSPGAPVASAARPPTPAPPAARSNVVPITSRLATAEKLAEPAEDLTVPFTGQLPLDPRPADAPSAGKAAGGKPAEAKAITAAVVADPFALPPTGAASLGSAASAGAASLGAASSGAAAGGGVLFVASAAPATAGGLAAPSISAIDSRGRKSPPWMAYAMLAAAVAFGVTTAIAIFFRPAAQPAPVVVQVPAAPTTTATAAAPTATATATESAEPTPTATTTAPKAVAMGGPRTAAAPSNPGKGPLDLHGLGGSISPTEDPGGNDGPRAPGQCFSSGQVQQVIGLHQAAIRRSCWERNPTTKPTVNVSVSLTIGPDGSAQGVSASAEEASVAKCVENDVRGWRFASMGCSQQTSFSFHFVRQ